MTDQTTRRAEQIREETGKPWELCCQQAERERDTAPALSDPLSADESATMDEMIGNSPGGAEQTAALLLAGVESARAGLSVSPYAVRPAILKAAAERIRLVPVGGHNRAARILALAAKLDQAAVMTTLPAIGSRVLLPNFRGQTFTYATVLASRPGELRIELERPGYGDRDPIWIPATSAVLARDQRSES